MTVAADRVPAPSAPRPVPGQAPAVPDSPAGAESPASPSPADTVDVRGLAAAALERARTHLLGLQQPAGWWKGELATNVTMDAEDLLLREFLGIRTASRDRAGGPLDPLAAARRRHVGQLRGRPRRPVHHA